MWSVLSVIGVNLGVVKARRYRYKKSLFYRRDLRRRRVCLGGCEVVGFFALIFDIVIFDLRVFAAS